MPKWAKDIAAGLLVAAVLGLSGWTYTIGAKVARLEALADARQKQLDRIETTLVTVNQNILELARDLSR